MTTVRPAVYVEPPSLVPYEGGLYAAAQPLNPPDDVHWIMGGVEWESLAAYVAALYPTGIDAMCDTSRPDKVLGDSLGVTRAWPFTVFAGIDCGSVGRLPEDYRTRALRILELSGQHAAESVLWSGDGTYDPVLGTGVNGLNGFEPDGTTPLATVLTSGAVSLVDALSRLERWIGNNYNARAVIHAERALGAYADNLRLAHVASDEADRLETLLGNRWSFGAGYDGSAPGGAPAAANTSWVYVTGQLYLARGEPNTPADYEQAINRTLNTVAVVAEQPFLIGIDGPWAAAQVQLEV